jgi:hypothetical protein
MTLHRQLPPHTITLPVDELPIFVRKKSGEMINHLTAPRALLG